MTLQQDRERYEARDLRVWIEAQGGVKIRQVGSHQSYRIERPGPLYGRVVPCPIDGFPCSRNLTSAVARQFDRDRNWLLDQLGVERHRGGRIRRGIARREVAQPTRKDVLRDLDEITALANAIRPTLVGQRDPEHYRRMLGHLVAAKADLGRAAATAGAAA